MPIRFQSDARLIDAQGQSLGTVSFDKVAGDRVFGRFAATANFDAARSLFRQFEDAVSDQLFSDVEELGLQIERLGLQLAPFDGDDALNLTDVQIMNETDFSCRIPNLALTQEPPAALRVG
jgi:hypothetical protein